MKRVVAADKGETIEDELGEPYKLAHEVTYVMHTWLDHRKHGGYPEAGGYNNQCPFLMADWHTMNLYHSRVEKGIFSEIAMPTSGLAWGEFLSE